MFFLKADRLHLCEMGANGEESGDSKAVGVSGDRVSAYIYPSAIPKHSQTASITVVIMLSLSADGLRPQLFLHCGQRTGHPLQRSLRSARSGSRYLLWLGAPSEIRDCFMKRSMIPAVSPVRLPRPSGCPIDVEVPQYVPQNLNGKSCLAYVSLREVEKGQPTASRTTRS